MLVKKPKLIALMNDFDGIDTFHRFMVYVKKLTPNSKVITFGRLSNQIPKFFLKYNIDAIHFSGDYEDGVINYWKYVNNEQADCPGVYLKVLPERDIPLGSYIDPKNWVLPDITEIPYKAYGQMYINDLNKFCGIPQRQELIIPVARGCPIGCFFCDVPKMQGKFERRLPVDVTVDYIVSSFSTLPFEYVSFYSPTFTLNKIWVMELCEALSKLPKHYSWKCTTALSCLNEKLIISMAQAGCVRISLGIETITGASTSLPKTKQNVNDQLPEIINIAKQHNVELNAFIILGLPGDNPNDVTRTFEYCMVNNIRVRPTIYTPYHEMVETMSEHEVSTYNRQTFIDNLLSDEESAKYYELFYNNPNDKLTQVMHKINRYNELTQA